MSKYGYYNSYGYGHHHHGHWASRNLCCRILVGVAAVILLVLFVVLVIFLVLHPTKPEYYLRDLSVQQFNLTLTSNFTTSSTLSTVFQVTFYSRNPNSRIGIYYDTLDASAEYNNQQITAATSLPTGYQGHKDAAVWSPFLHGEAILVDSYMSQAIWEDENAGLMLISMKMDGRLRWKVGTWVSGHYRILVNCPAILVVGKGGKGNGNGNGNGNVDGGLEFKFGQKVTCSVEV